MAERNGKARSVKNIVGKLGIELVVVALALPSTLIVLTSLSSQPAMATGWGPRILITDDNVNNDHWSHYASIATDISRNVYVVWQDLSELDGSGSDSDVFLKKWDASTETWGPRVLVTDDNLNNTVSSHGPRVETDSFGNVHVAWMNHGDLDGGGDDQDIFWKMWDVSTGTWGSRLLVSEDVNNTMNSFNPRLASDRFGNMHLLWEDWSPLYPHDGVQYRKWDGTSRTWEERMTVTTNSSGSWLTDIDVDPSGNVHVAWSDQANISGASTYAIDYDIFYRRLDASSNVWGPIVHINDDDNDTDSNGSNFWSLTTDVFGNVHTTWSEFGDQTGSGTGEDDDIFYRKWNAATALWEPRVLISHDPPDTNKSYYSVVRSDPFGNLHIVWVDNTWPHGAGTPHENLLYRKWNVATDSWDNAISLTDDLPEEFRADNPDMASDNLGNLYVVWNDGSGLLGSGSDHDIYLRKFTSDIGPIPHASLRTEVVDTDDILLTWTVPDSPTLDHYRIYRSTDPREFDSSTPIYSTSSDINPLRKNWTDIHAAGSTAPKEYYYIVRAVSQSGDASITSNTAGKWTRTFREGRNAFSLPLEPFVNRNASWYSENIPGTEFIRWMNATGHWVTHYPSMGEGVNDNPTTMADSYEISLSSPINFTFCGFPASMIRFQEGLGDSTTFRKSLSAEVEGDDVNLSWESTTGAIEYLVFRSNKRNGLHDLSLSPIANITNTRWIDSGVIGSERSEYYYMIIPVDSSGGLGSSTYSVGLFTVEYQSGSGSFALPLKPVETHSLDWFCDNIPNVVGIVHMMKGYWRLHAMEMPEGVYDAEASQAEGYQILIDGATTTYTFIGY